MRKPVLFVIMTLAICALLFVSCKQEPIVPGKDGFIHVKTFAEFERALEAAKSTEKKTVVLDNDIEFDSAKYPGKKGANHDAATTMNIDVTGLTIDLGGHVISNVPRSNAFNLMGDSFTVKNGKITVSATACNSSVYALCINYSGVSAQATASVEGKAKRPGSYSDSDSIWKKRIIIDDLECDGLIIGYSTAEIKNCKMKGGIYRELVMWGTSGTIENTDIDGSDATNGALVVTCYGVVTLKSDVTVKGKRAFQIDYAGNIRTAAGATGITATASASSGWAAYVLSQSVLELGPGVTLKAAAGGKLFKMEKCAQIIINSGAVLKDGAEADVPKPLAADNDAYVVLANKGVKYDNSLPYTAEMITDNR